MRKKVNKKETGAIITMVDQMQLELPKSSNLLTFEEKEWIRWLIYPFRTSEITCIQLKNCNQPIEDETPREQFIDIDVGFGMKSDSVFSCRFIKGEHCRGMNPEQKYTAKELGL